MTKKMASACGKIILSGEYAVVFGYRGIAMPSKQRVHIDFHLCSEAGGGVRVEWKDAEKETSTWLSYVENIAALIQEKTGATGAYVIDNQLPLGKGMGSSTAFVIAMCRASLGPDCEEVARSIEDEVNPGHSGLDFAVIWGEKSLLFQRGKEATVIDLSQVLPSSLNFEFIDTGPRTESASELVAWVKNLCSGDSTIAAPIHRALGTIGRCTERILAGEDLKTVIRDHHRAQVALGVVPESARRVIEEAEAKGGAAKVLGAGSRTGGGGMVMAVHHS